MYGECRILEQALHAAQPTLTAPEVTERVAQAILGENSNIPAFCANHGIDYSVITDDGAPLASDDLEAIRTHLQKVLNENVPNLEDITEYCIGIAAAVEAAEELPA